MNKLKKNKFLVTEQARENTHSFGIIFDYAGVH
jgi:hypothetical protein